MEENNEYSVRRFGPEDLTAYRNIRLEALMVEPGVFGNSYAMELAFPESQWMARLTDEATACFGLYHGGLLIGLTAITTTKDGNNSAYMNQSYIRKAYRGRGLSRYLFEARIAWAKGRGISRLLIGHRESNSASKAANQKFGFRYVSREPRQWPDGQQEDMLHYELLLMP